MSSISKELLSAAMPMLMSNPNLLAVPTLEWALKSVVQRWEALRLMNLLGRHRCIYANICASGTCG